MYWLSNPIACAVAFSIVANAIAVILGAIGLLAVQFAKAYWIVKNAERR